MYVFNRTFKQFKNTIQNNIKTLSGSPVGDRFIRQFMMTLMGVENESCVPERFKREENKTHMILVKVYEGDYLYPKKVKDLYFDDDLSADKEILLRLKESIEVATPQVTEGQVIDIFEAAAALGDGNELDDYPLRDYSGAELFDILVKSFNAEDLIAMYDEDGAPGFYLTLSETLNLKKVHYEHIVAPIKHTQVVNIGDTPLESFKDNCLAASLDVFGTTPRSKNVDAFTQAVLRLEPVLPLVKYTDEFVYVTKVHYQSFGGEMYEYDSDVIISLNSYEATKLMQGKFKTIFPSKEGISHYIVGSSIFQSYFEDEHFKKQTIDSVGLSDLGDEEAIQIIKNTIDDLRGNALTDYLVKHFNSYALFLNPEGSILSVAQGFYMDNQEIATISITPLKRYNSRDYFEQALVPNSFIHNRIYMPWNVYF